MSRFRFSNPGKVRAGSPTKWVIVIFAFFVIAFSWAAPLQRIQFERQEAIREAVRENRNRVATLQQYVSRTLEAADIVTLHVAERYQSPNSPLRKGSAGKPATIDGAIAQSRSFLGISVVDAKGDLVASTLGRRASVTNVRGKEAFDVHIERDIGRLFISKPAFTRFWKRDVLWLTRRLNNPDGSFGGVVAINIAPEQFTAIYEDVTVNPTDVISLIGLDGITRARRSGRQVSAGEDLRGRLVMQMQRKDPNGSYLGPSGLDGLMRYFSHRRVEGYPMFATYGVLQDIVLQPIEKRARLFYIIAALASLITAAFAFVLVAMVNRRDRHAAEIAETNLRLEEAQRIGQIGDWSYDIETGVVSWSDQLLKMYERDPADGPLLFSEFEALLDEDSKKIVADAISVAIETGEPQSYEIKAKLPSGKESYRLVYSIPTRGPNGKVVRLHGIDQDISARKKLDRLEMEVTHLSRLDAMNAMAATLAHELNQPLAAASNYLAGTHRALQAANFNEGPATEGVEAAQKQVRFAGEIIRRVRSMVTKERKAVAPASVTRIIDDSIALVTAGDNGGVRITRTVTADASMIHADRVQIQQVLMNLIRNAREATARVEKPTIVVRSARGEGGQVVISVEDNGPGFAEGVEPFSPFSSSGASGLGLGLSISRTIVESHGGRIWVDTAAGEGGRVRFTIPAVDEAKEARSA